MRGVELGIYGLGRFGAFWAAELARHFPVCAYSRRSHPAPAGVRLVSEHELLRCPVVVLCVAISAMEEVVERISPHLGPDSLVMDTCSIKGFPARVMAERLPAATRILATHPLFGPDSARAGVAGQPMILCPVRLSDDEYRAWERRFSDLGLRVITMTPDQHDREAAFSQGITHYLGRVLAEMGLKRHDHRDGRLPAVARDRGTNLQRLAPVVPGPAAVQSLHPGDARTSRTRAHHGQSTARRPGRRRSSLIAADPAAATSSLLIGEATYPYVTTTIAPTAVGMAAGAAGR